MSVEKNIAAATQRAKLRMRQQFDSVANFFDGWGLNPTDDEAGISGKVYSKLIKEAERYMSSSDLPIGFFGRFCMQQISSTDDKFYLRANSYEELEEAWDQFIRDL